MRGVTTAVIVTVLTLGLLASASDDEGLAVDRVLADVQKHYDGVTSLRCAFEQENKYLGGDSLIQKGTLELMRPSKMRWDYAEPTPRQFISDGNSLWVVHPDENKAFVMSDTDSEMQTRMMNFVIGLQDVRNDFDVTIDPAGGGRADNVRLVLTAKQPIAGVDHILVDVDPATHAITAVIIDDGMGNQTITRLSEMVTNPKDLLETRFTYTAPEGVEVMPYN